MRAFFNFNRFRVPPCSFAFALCTTWFAIPVTIFLLEAFCDNLIATFAEMLLAFVWSIVALLSIFASALHVAQRAWAKSILAVALPVAMTTTSSITPADFSPVMVPLGLAIEFARGLTEWPAHEGDILHFMLAKPSYDRSVDALPHTGSRFQEFNWGGMRFLSRGGVYDESDDIASEHHSSAWIARMRNTDVTCGGSSTHAVETLWGHYYLTEFGC